MQEFDGNIWTAAKGDVEIDVTPRHNIDISVSCTKTVQVLGVSGAPGTSSVVLRSGTEFRFRGPVKNFQKIVIRGTGETMFGYSLRHKPRQHGEPLSDERPPVIDLGEPSNLVAKMRRMSQEHHRQNRMPVLEPEDGPSFNRYEFDDDEEMLFEEELIEKAQEEKAKLLEKEKVEARKEAETGETPVTPSQSSGEPPAPASEQNGGSPPPNSATPSQQAAE